MVKYICAIIIVLGALLPNTSRADVIHCYSPAFESGVKRQMAEQGVDSLTTEYCDTLSVLNLSGMSIEDVRDILLFPNLRILDLGFNRLRNIDPLCELDSLHELYLNGNELRSISVLSMTHSDSLYVDVSWNRIQDFSIFAGYNSCMIQVVGQDKQILQERAYLDVSTLSASVDADRSCSIIYNVLTNSQEPQSLQIGIDNYDIEADGQTHLLALPQGLSSTTRVTISDDERIFETYAVPYQLFGYAVGEERVIDLGLPADYSLTHVWANGGSVAAENNLLHFVPSEEAEEVTVHLFYSQGLTEKGYTQLSLVPCQMGDVNLDGNVDDYDIFAMVEYLMERTPATFSTLAADFTGDGHVSVADITALINLLGR